MLIIKNSDDHPTSIHLHGWLPSESEYHYGLRIYVQIESGFEIFILEMDIKFTTREMQLDKLKTSVCFSVFSVFSTEYRFLFKVVTQKLGISRS